MFVMPRSNSSIACICFYMNLSTKNIIRHLFFFLSSPRSFPTSPSPSPEVTSALSMDPMNQNHPKRSRSVLIGRSVPMIFGNGSILRRDSKMF